MEQLRTAARYEAFIRDGAKVNYRAEWHPGDKAPFLGPERFVKKIAKEPVTPSSSRRATLRDLLKCVAAKSGLSAETLLRKGRLGSVVNARDRFSAKQYCSRAIPPLRSLRFSIAMHQTSAVRCRRLSRLRQVCHNESPTSHSTSHLSW